MNNLWKWLMKADAKAVFTGAIILMSAVSAWWIWKIKFTEISYTLKKEFSVRKTNFSDLKLLSLFDLANFPSPSNSPFNYPKIKKITKTPPIVVKPKETTPEIQPKREEALPAPKKEEPPPVLTYKGLFKRPDGKLVILVHDSKTGKDSFNEIGTEIYGYIVNTARLDEIVLISKKGNNTVSLKLDQPQPVLKANP